MRSVAEHQALVAGLIEPPGPARVPLAGAAGRVLARDYAPARPLPGFDNSAMDGYAVRAADVAAARTDAPVVLPVAADIPAGRPRVPPLAPGTAHQIMTGAPLPAGADTVVPVEATDGGTVTVAIFDPGRPGRHVRTAGSDVRAGQKILAAGTVLGPAQLGLLAALGETAAEIMPPLRVLVVSTGSELVPPGAPLAGGQVHDANTVMLAAAVEAAGARADCLAPVTDDVAGFRAALAARLPRPDLILTSAGVSAGAFEVVREALAGQGVEFAPIAMQPGRPQGAGRVRGVPAVCLPGNPVSALVSFEVLVRPALRAAMGLPQARRPVLTGRLAEPLRSPPGKRQFHAASLEPGEPPAVHPVSGGCHSLAGLAGAGALLDISEDVTFLPRGAAASVWVLTGQSRCAP